jgi:aspartate racemase
MREAVVGVLGGMGPDATARLFQLLIEATPATRDQDHLRILIDNNTKVPDRMAAILGQGADPFPYLEASARTLETAGADFLVMPCNTAHYWLGDLRQRVGVPIVDMVTETAAAVRAHRPALERVGLLATAGARRVRLYEEALSRAGLLALHTTPEEQEFIMTAIYEIKAGDRAVGAGLARIGRSLLGRGAEGVILGCTELSLVDEMRELGCPLFDPLVIVARRTVEIAKNWDEGRAALLGSHGRPAS